MSTNERLRKIIEERGLKQSYIAQIVGISCDRVSKILNGNRKMLADEFLLICTALNIDPNIFRKDA